MLLFFSDAYFDDTDDCQVSKSIFLAGPTVRYATGDTTVSTWRHEAIRLLEEMGYDGVVYIPVPEQHFKVGNIVENEIRYEHQIDWELTALHRSDVIFFYVERTEVNIGLTTNVEFGMFKDSGRVVYTRPEDAIHIQYLDAVAKRANLPVYADLRSGLAECVDRIGEGELRKGVQCKVPLLFWRADQFRDWYITHQNQGNKLLAFEAKSVITLNNDRELFGFSAWVSIWIANEDREKSCEWIFSRTHATYTVPFFTNPNGSRSYILVRDFRSTSTNKKGYVYELPGGSLEEGLDPQENAAKELEEELGLPAASTKGRLVPMGIHQPYAIFSINVVIPYLLELTPEEVEKLVEVAETGKVLGENQEERIKLCIINERSFIDTQEFPIDLFTFGLIRLSDAYAPRNKNALPSPNYPRSYTLK